MNIDEVYSYNIEFSTIVDLASAPDIKLSNAQVNQSLIKTNKFPGDKFMVVGRTINPPNVEYRFMSVTVRTRN